MADRRRNKSEKGQQAEQTGQTPDGLRRRLFFAHLTLWWERAWRLAWPLPALLLTFVSLALFDVLPLLPGWLHATILGIFLVAGLVVLWRLRRLSWPVLPEARQRLEQDSGFGHQPLQSLADRLSAGADDPVSQALWQAERRRVRYLLPGLTLRSPAPDLARHDPAGLRFVPLLLLAIALSGGWHDGQARLVRALEPNLGRLVGPPPVLQVWLTPPPYTGKAPMLLDTPSSRQPIALPADSSLLAVLQGGKGKAQLFIDDEPHPFQALDGDSQRLESPIAKASRLVIRQGRRQIAAWSVTILAVEPPSIGFASPPEADRDGRLRLDIEGRDAYGIAKAWATIRRIDSPKAPPLNLNLPLGGAHPATVRQAAWHDLTGHPWAGLPVSIEPGAENVAGRQATGTAVTTILPERNFTNPVAKAIVAERRTLAATPERRREVAGNLAAIATHPEKFGNDLVVYLALSTSVSRLIQDQSPEAVPSVVDILWQAALRVEDGDKPAAQLAVDEAARNLEQALSEGASQAEIERLMSELQSAMARYLDAIAEQAARQGTPLLPDDPEQPSVSAEELDGMLERMRDLSRTGSPEAARQLLSELRQMLDGLSAPMQGGPAGEQARQAQQALKDLQDMARQQRQLLDDTFRRTQPGPGQGAGTADPQGTPQQGGRENGTPRPGNAGKADAQRQEALRKRLGQTLQALGDLGADVPDALGQAEQAMRESTQALRQDDLQSAVDAQTEALARLQEGSQAAAQSLARQMGPGMMRQGRGPGRDPLGRPLQGRGNGEDHTVKIPDQAATQKAREVLDELRRRAGQAERPTFERDYLQRLLKQFF